MNRRHRLLQLDKAGLKHELTVISPGEGATTAGHSRVSGNIAWRLRDGPTGTFGAATAMLRAGSSAVLPRRRFDVVFCPPQMGDALARVSALGSRSARFRRN